MKLLRLHHQGSDWVRYFAGLQRIALWAAVLLLGACQQAEPKATAATPVQVKATGELVAATSFKVTPPAVKGLWQYSLKMLAPESSLLQQDQPAAIFDDQSLQEQLKNKQSEQQSSVQELSNQLQQDEQRAEELKLQLAEQKMVYERDRRKAEITDHSASANDRRKAQIDFTLAANQFKLAQSRLAAHQLQRMAKAQMLQAKIDRLQSEVSLLETDIQRMQVTAPFTGMLVYSTDFDGEKYSVGDSVQFGEPVAEVSQLESLYVRAVIDEIDLVHLTTGLKVTIALDAYPEKNFTGVLKSLGSAVRDQAYNDLSRVIDASISLDQPDPSLMRPGMSVRLTILLANTSPETKP